MTEEFLTIRRPAALAFAAVALLVVLSGCVKVGTEAAGATASAEIVDAAEDEGVFRWMPVYPDSEVEVVYSKKTEEGIAGLLSVTARADAREVARFYRDELKARQFEIHLAPFETQFGRGARISGFSAGETEGINATVTPEQDFTQVLINYTYAEPGSSRPTGE